MLPDIEWCDKVIVVDSQSSDDTREVAREHGAKVVDVPQVEPGEPFDHFRQDGVDAATNEWILNLDVDESIPNTLREELTLHIEKDEAEDIVETARVNYLGDRQMRGAGQWPDYGPTLFRRDAIRFQPITHAFADYRSDLIRRLPAQEELAIHHDFADSVLDHFRAQRRYAKIAGNYRDFKFRHLLSPPYGFYKRFLRQRGYRDGFAGLGISLCWAWYQAEVTVRSALTEAGTR